MTFMRRLFTVFIISLLAMNARAQVAAGATIVTNTTLFCTGTPITYSLSSAAQGLSYSWSVIPSKGLSSYTDLNNSDITLTFSGIVTYTVSCTITDDSGASRTIHTTVTPARSAIASFNASLNAVGFPTQLVLTNYSSYSLKHYWRFNDNSVDSSENVIRDYTAGGSYSVTLFVLGSKGCNDSSSYRFRISDSSSISLPNVFTPNGDGVNDVYIPVTRGIASLKAWVYNRNGILVCTWDKPKGGWDGHSTSGEECSDGVYMVAVDAFGFDGKAYHLKGTITLIR